jgi:CRP-like cAMP-binding protein/Flp pilus assembly protein TadD
MVLSLFSGKETSIPELIAKKKYAQAVSTLRDQLKSRPDDTGLLIQLADVLALDNKNQQAVQILEKAADQFSADGFTTKAIAALKRIERLDPGSSLRVKAKLDSLVRTSEPSPPPKAAPPPQASHEISIDFELDDSEPMALDIGMAPAHEPEPSPPPPATEPKPVVAAKPEPAPAPVPEPEPEPKPEPEVTVPEPEPEPQPDFLSASEPPAPDFLSEAPDETPDFLAPDDGGVPFVDFGGDAAEEPEPAAVVEPEPEVVVPEPEPEPEPELVVPEPEPEPEVVAIEPEPIPEEVVIEPEPEEVAIVSPEPEEEVVVPEVEEPAEIVPDIEPEIDDFEAVASLEPEVVAVEPEPEPAPIAAAEEEDLDLSRLDLDAILDAAVDAVESDHEDEAPLEETEEEEGAFSSLTQDELADVIQGLGLQTFEPGDVIVSQGEPGDSMFVIASGAVKIFQKAPGGKSSKLAELYEGDFFGELALLSGKPRTATIIASSRCELLELDHDTLEDISSRHPRVKERVLEIYNARANSAAREMLEDIDEEDVAPAPAPEPPPAEPEPEPEQSYAGVELKDTALEMMKAGQWTDASALWELYLGVSPLDTSAQASLGLCLAKVGNWPAAVVAFESVTADNPSDASSFFSLAVAYSKVGRMADSKVALQKTLEADPNHAKAKAQLAKMG